MDDLLKEFLVESHENLDRLDRDLVALEKNPESRELIASIFRTIHTIKGTSGFLALGKLEAVAHQTENLLSRLREGRLTLNAEITAAMLEGVDRIREIIRCIEETEKEGDGDDSALIALLTRLLESAAPKPAAAAKPVAPAPKPAAVAKSAEAKAPAAPAPAAAPTPKPAAPAPVEVKKESAPSAQEHAKSALSDSSIRVDVGLLDRLMNLVGELVLARNQIIQVTSRAEDAAFTATSQRLNLITTELQAAVMKTRMQPVGGVWSKFPRVVRDVSADLGKKVELEMSGTETELDRTIIEAIKDPLTHIIRNAVDHGIETPEQRKAAGKSEVARVLLRALHDGGQVLIELCDDGRGIDPAKIRSKALERGLIAPEQSARMGEREVIQLIFQPGFSTAEKITNVSGRGVGMDVVKTNVERIGGSVDIESKLGSGTAIRIRIPLTLAIIPALIVRVAHERYAIPQSSLVELVRAEAKKGKAAFERIQGTPVYRLRGRLLPLLFLAEQLQLAELKADAAINIVVLQTGAEQFGLVVDGVEDTAEIVVKPLGKHFKEINCYAGATIMGDGRPALILDVDGLAKRSGIQAKTGAIGTRKEAAVERKSDTEKLLLFGFGDGTRFAMPLSAVARLEEFPRSSIERSGRREVIQYRDEILQLVRVASVLTGSEHHAEDGTERAVVYSHEGRRVGVIVGRIEDIVETKIELRETGRRPGVRGTTVINERVTDVVDVAGMLQAADAGLFTQAVA
ncbi:MAG: chemotaxis protein CheA [Opitutaceae bacterium]